MMEAAQTGDWRWKAVDRRDPDADGRFFCCVRTTGVYCRPSCAGRPQRKNVFFVATRSEAERAGLRPCKRCRPDRLVVAGLEDRISSLDWEKVETSLEAGGFARLGRLLDDADCAGLESLYSNQQGFRSTVIMGRHGYGAGEYRYFADPLPPLVSGLRRLLYARLAPLASRWRSDLGGAGEFPPDHASYRAICAKAGQRRPTPLLLSYGSGDYNRLHQDLYGGEIFPVQVAILLSEPRKDFEGGEFILTEQRPRMQSRVHVVGLEKGDAVAFAVSQRPVKGVRGTYRATMRHGVATVSAGRRMTLGVIFHDAA